MEVTVDRWEGGGDSDRWVGGGDSDRWVGGGDSDRWAGGVMLSRAYLLECFLQRTTDGQQH